MPEYDSRGIAACCAFIFFGLTSTLVVKASEQNGRLPYNSTSANFIVEWVKFVSMIVCWSLSAPTPEKDDNRSWTEKKLGFQPSLRNMAPYAVPGLMYAVQNQLLFHAVVFLQPAMFQLASKLKFVSTAVLSRIVLKKSLTTVQWLGLLLLLFGMTTSKGSMFCPAPPKAAEHSASRQLAELDTDPTKQLLDAERSLFIGMCMVLTTSTISGASGIANEFLLKHHDEQVSIFMKNAQLYLWGVIFNLIGVLGEMWAKDAWHPLGGFNKWTWIVISLKAAEGVSISFIMRYLDNLIKCFASAIIVYLTAFVSFVLFDEPIDSFFVGGLAIVSIALALYFGPFNDILKEHEKPWVFPEWKQSTLMSWQVRLAATAIVIIAVLCWGLRNVPDLAV